MNALEQYESDMASLADLNKRFHVRILVKAVYAPWPIEAVDIDKLPELLKNHSIIHKGDTNV